MQTPLPASDPSNSRLNRQQSDIYIQLRDHISFGLASFYRDACVLRAQLADENSEKLETATHLIMHCLREVESGLRVVLLPGDFSFKESRDGKGKKQELEIETIATVIKLTQEKKVFWLALAREESEVKLDKLVHRVNLEEPRSISGLDYERWQKIDDFLEETISKFTLYYIEITIPKINSLVSRTPLGPTSAKDFYTTLPRTEVACALFFQKARVEWLQVLVKHEKTHEAYLFRRIPKTWVTWPPAKYLVRIAKQIQAGDIKAEAVNTSELQGLILDAMKLSESEEPITSTRILWDFCEILLSLPIELSIQMMDSILSWTSYSPLWNYSDKLAEFAVRLAQNNQVKLAIQIIEKLLNPAKLQSGRMELYEYETICKQYLPDLIAVAHERIIPLLCQWLAQVIRASQFYQEGVYDDLLDDSWQEPIGEARDRTIKNILVTVLRDAVMQVATADVSLIPGLVRELESHQSIQSAIFWRLSLHLIAQHLDSGEVTMLAQERVLNRVLFDVAAAWGSVTAEYHTMFRLAFPKFGETEQSTLLNWIGILPQVQQRSWLFLVKDNLPPGWKTTYEGLGVPSSDELRSGNAPLVSITDLISSEDFLSKSIDEVIQDLETGQPSGQFGVPAQGSLRFPLMDAIAASPTRFVDAALRFKDLNPMFISGFFWGLIKAIEKKNAFSWQPVIELSQVVVNVRQGEEIWRQIAKSIADLFTHGMGQNTIPFDLRIQVWNIIAVLCKDLDPTPDEESRRTLLYRTAFVLSLDTVRARAMRAAIQYAFWVNSQLNQNQPEQAIGFSRIREVEVVLDDHLASDSSLTVRAVYGCYFVNLMDLDSTWATKNSEKIFPTDETLAEQRNAAWNAYILSGNVYAPAFELLKQHYIDSFARPKSPVETEQFDKNFYEAMAGHLILLYEDGELLLEDELLTLFFGRTVETIRGHAIDFAGKRLDDTKATDRLKALWLWRLEKIKRENAPAGELSAFSRWVKAKKFDVDWTLTQIREILRLKVNVDNPFVIMQYLAEVASEALDQTLNILEPLIEEVYHSKSDVLHACREEMRNILSKGLQNSDPTVQENARRLVSSLITKRYFDYANLLDQKAAS